ncbi:MAG: YceI family protein [Burkholderiaceae bacterium]
MTSIKSTIDTSQSKVSFQIKQIGFLTVKGTIVDFQGNIDFNENELGKSNFNVSISPINIDTGNAKRDEHLKSKDFFYVKEYPKISFQSTKIIKEKEQFLAIGQLTILNKTNEVSIPFSHENRSLNGNFSLNRLDFDLGVKFPSFIVGKTVQISINTKIK